MDDAVRQRKRPPRRQIDSVVIHFDYDCFYASVFEHENPALKSLPLAVQQKQIVVTCNYEARRRGLYKLQLITEAKKVCPDVVIVLGEDLNPFRDASKELFAFLRSFSWNSRCERLGFDEVFLDVADIIEYNVGILNTNDLSNSFFNLSKTDPTVGFAFDANQVCGHRYPESINEILDATSLLDPLYLRLLLASHLAQHLRQQLESQKGYTATVGISTNKLLAKLVGNLKKPNAQTTLLPPYVSWDNIEGQDNVTTFMDNHEIGKIPGIGFKMAQKLRAHVLQRSPDFDAGLVYGGTKEKVRVCEVRQYPGMGPDLLERILGGTGTPHGIGARVWGLLNGCDDSEVGQARVVPRQISIEDSYLRLDNMDKVAQELRMLARSLLRRIHTDLIEDGVEDGSVQALPEAIAEGTATSKRWIAHPRTVRLSTRPRPPQNPDGSRHRSFARISKSAPMPNFVFNSGASIEDVAERLVSETLLPLFRRLHPEKTGWNLSLVNVAVTNMADAASEKGGVGRNISNMFKRQDDVLKAWRVEEGKEERDGEEKNEEEEEAWIGVQDELRPIATASGAVSRVGSEDAPTLSQSDATVLKDVWESDGEDMTEGDTYCCEDCGALMPLFAMGAHIRWHAQG